MDTEHKKTDEQLAKMERRLDRIYREASKTVGEQWKEDLQKVDKEVKALQKAYDKAKQGGDKQEIRKAGAALQRAKKHQTLLNVRYRDLTKQLAGDISRINEIALAYINGNLPEIYTVNYNQIAKQVDGIVDGFSFTLLDADTVRNLSLADESLLPYKYVNRYKDVRWNIEVINSQVLQGILAGEPVKKTAERLEKVLGMNKNSAMNNARTAVTSAECKGRQDSYKKADEMGIILEKRWLATDDSKVRDAHRELNGKTVPQDKPFDSELGEIMFPGDPHAEPANIYRCRCSIRAIVKGFRKL